MVLEEGVIASNKLQQKPYSDPPSFLISLVLKLYKLLHIENVIKSYSWMLIIVEH
jgi:hypothetical protein